MIDLVCSIALAGRAANWHPCVQVIPVSTDAPLKKRR